MLYSRVKFDSITVFLYNYLMTETSWWESNMKIDLGALQAQISWNEISQPAPAPAIELPSIQSSTGIDKEAATIMRTYSIIYKIFFSFWTLLLSFVVSGILLNYFNQQVSAFQQIARTDSVIPQERLLKTQYEQFLSDTRAQDDIEIFIKEWSITFTGSIVQSANNFATYKGFVLPKNISVSRNLPIKGIEELSVPNYDPRELWLFMKNFIFTTNEEIVDTKRTNKSLSVGNNSIVDYFNLSCTQSYKLIQTVCQDFFLSFIDVLYVYDLKNDYEWLRAVFESIKTDIKRRNAFCAELETYILYANNASRELESIFQQCGGQELNTFDMLKWYFIIQDQLLSEWIDDDTYNHRQLNAYKLLSTQQAIYNELSNKRFNQLRLSSYLKFVESLLKKQMLDPLYYDVIYVFNNDYLRRTLSQTQFHQNPQQSLTIKKVLEKLREVNEGSRVFGYEWLSTQLLNRSLTQIYGSNESILTFEDAVYETLLDRFNAEVQIERFRVNSQRMQWTDKLAVAWTFLIEESLAAKFDVDEKINAAVVFTLKNEQFVVSAINVEKYTKLTDIVQDFIRVQDLSISRVYDIIIENLNIFVSDDATLTVCDRINDLFVSTSIIWCNESRIIIAGKHPWKQEAIQYLFVLNGGRINRIVVDDPVLADLITDTYDLWSTDIITLASLIFTIVKTPLEQPDQVLETIDPEVQTNIVYITTQVNKFLQVKPREIIEKDGVYIVDFTLKWVDYLSIFNLNANALQTIIFKDNTQLQIKDFVMPMDESAIIELEVFLEEPLEYLRNINSLIVRLYEKSRQ